MALHAVDVTSGVASVQELDAAASAPRVLARIAEPLVLALRRFEAEGFAAFAAAFRRRDLLLDRPVRTTLPAAAEGIARGVDERGALRVQTADGLCAVSSGEVSVRLGAPGGIG